jgi:limonene-1,2-epoxide hydrolase
MSEENIKTVESYFKAMREKDLDRAPLADDLVFENPMVGKGKGAESFKAFLIGFLPAIHDVRVLSHICEGDFVATRWETETIFGTIQIADFFHLREGKIIEVRAYFDPRPLFG